MKILLFVLLFIPTFVSAQTYHRAASVESRPPEISHIQVWNPPESGVTCIIERLQVSGHAQRVVIGMAYQALLSLAYSQPWWINTANGNIAFGHCELRWESKRAEQDLGQLDNVSIGDVAYVWTGLLVIPPGFGMTVRADRPGTLIGIGVSGSEQLVIGVRK